MPQSECHGLFSHWNWFTDSRCRPKDCNSYKPIWVTVFGPTFLVPLWEHLSLTTEWQIDWSFLFFKPGPLTLHNFYSSYLHHSTEIRFIQNYGDCVPVWHVCLKIENCCLKIFVKIRVNKKVWKYVKYCLKTENSYLKTQTKHPLHFRRI